MPHKPHISILMPFKDTARYLPGCLDSILAQSDPDWELIAVDDHSSDNSFDILDSYRRRDARIGLYRNPGKGIIPALRHAYDNSRGTLISRMDSDDLMVENKMAALRAELEKEGPGHVSTGMVRYFPRHKLGRGYLRYEKWINRLCIEKGHFREIYRECVIPSPCWMCYRQDLDSCGAFDPFRYPEDYDLCFRMYRHNFRVCSVGEVLHEWRDHPRRASRNLEEYADPFYFELKIRYFLELEFSKGKELVLWGAGSKGKRLAELLNRSDVHFRWVCNNPRKWGKMLRGQKVEPTSIVEQLYDPLIIIAVSAPDAQREIKSQLIAADLELGRHFHFFC